MCKMNLSDYQNLNAKIADAEAIRDNIRSVARRIIEGDVNAVDELSPLAFDLLTSASTSASKRQISSAGKAITQEAQEEATQFIYNMGERVQALQDVRNKVLQIFNAGDELTNSGAKVLLDDIDGVIRESEEILRTMNRNYIDSMFQDPTVIGAQKLDDLVDAFSKSILGRGKLALDPNGNLIPDQELDDLIDEIKKIYKQGGRRKGVPYEAVKRYDKFFDDLKAYKKLADDLDPEVLYASTIAQAVKNLPEAQTAINDLAGINVIADEISKVKASLQALEGNQLSMFPNPQQVAELTERLSVLEARELFAQEALIQPYREKTVDNLYTNIAGPAQRRIDELRRKE